MHPTTPRLSLLAPLLSGLLWPAFAGAGEPAAPAGHVHGVAHLDINVEGSEIAVKLSAPSATLVGYERAPQTPDERQTLRLAAENLKTGDALVRFNTEADCVLLKADVDADPGGTKRGKGAGGHSDLGASYRFSCGQPAALSSAALGLFVGFPALERVLIRYATPGGRGDAELTPRNPVVSFVPLY